MSFSGPAQEPNPSLRPAIMSNLKEYQTELIEHGMAVGALKFGSFTLKSGRSVVPT